MKKLVGLAVVALLVLGVVKLVHGRSTEAKAHAACENIVEQCAPFAKGELTKSDVAECTADFMKDGPRELGDKYEPLVSCMASADSCGEVIGCAGGAFAGVLEHQMHGFGRGLDRMTK